MALFHHEAKAIFGIDRLITARVGDLFVEEIGVPFEIRESDGQETIWDVSRRREIAIPGPAVEGGRAVIPPTPNTSTTSPGMAGTGGVAHQGSVSREISMGVGGRH